MNMSYIGMTSRYLGTRIEEHLDCSLKNKHKNAIKDHLSVCQKCFEISYANSFQIMSHCKNDYDTKIQEALLICKFRPKLNIQQFNNGA